MLFSEINQNEILMEGNKPEFQTQFDERLPLALQRTACGITAMFMGVNRLLDTPITYPDFVRDYITRASFSVPAIGLPTEIDGKPIVIPVNYYTNIPQLTTKEVQEAYDLIYFLNDRKNLAAKLVDISRADAAPRKAFTIARGFEHRGVNDYFKEKRLPLKAELLEGVTDLRALTERIAREDTVALLSVRHNDLGYPEVYNFISPQTVSTHVVMASDIKTLGNTVLVRYNDPAFLHTEDGIQFRTVQSLNNAFRGVATIIQRT